jgi:hypothetical protein
MDTTPNLTPASLALFLSLASSAADWAGEPLFEGDNAARGNLTHLKVTGLIETYTDDGCTFCIFTPAGKSLAASHGII